MDDNKQYAKHGVQRQLKHMLNNQRGGQNQYRDQRSEASDEKIWRCRAKFNKTPQFKTKIAN
jgi:hypothetical protein